MGYKVWINYGLVKLGIRKILPSKIINAVKVIENNEELVPITNKKIIIDSTVKNPYLRYTVNKKIDIIADILEKKGYKLKIYDAYRSFEEQKRSWEQRIKETKKEHPDASMEEIERLTSLKVAKPTVGHGGHQTGGAIDVTLTDLDGIELDMGTKYAEHSSRTKTDSKELTEEQKNNRKILLEVLKEQDFVNFPAEWWHYCYGDKMWAAYSEKKTCMYGYTEPKKRK